MLVGVAAIVVEAIHLAAGLTPQEVGATLLEVGVGAIPKVGATHLEVGAILREVEVLHLEAALWRVEVTLRAAAIRQVGATRLVEATQALEVIRLVGVIRLAVGVTLWKTEVERLGVMAHRAAVV